MTIEKPTGAERFDERYWREYRERARKRAGMLRTLLIGGAMIAIGVLGAILEFLVPQAHQAGPAAIVPPFTVVIPGMVAIAGLAIAVRAARWVRSDQGVRR